MAYTQTQLNDLEAAIAEGALSVAMNGRQITYRSLDDMERIASKIRRELATTNTAKVYAPTFDRGYQ